MVSGGRGSRDDMKKQLECSSYRANELAAYIVRKSKSGTPSIPTTGNKPQQGVGTPLLILQSSIKPLHSRSAKCCFLRGWKGF